MGIYSVYSVSVLRSTEAQFSISNYVYQTSDVEYEQRHPNARRQRQEMKLALASANK